MGVPKKCGKQDPYDSTNTCTNFLMGGTKYTKSISALQAGRIPVFRIGTP